MGNYAVIENNKIVNIIDAPSLEVAEEATGHTCVEHTNDNPAVIGWSYVDNTFVAPENPTE